MRQILNVEPCDVCGDGTVVKEEEIGEDGVTINSEYCTNIWCDWEVCHWQIPKQDLINYGVRKL